MCIQTTVLVYPTEQYKNDFTYGMFLYTEYNYVFGIELGIIKRCAIIVRFILVRLYADVSLNKKGNFIDFRK